MNHSEYEKFVEEIAPKLISDVDLKNLGKSQCGKSNMWVGVSGWEHQIDVSLHNDQDVFLVECKYWDHNVPATEFLTMWGRVMDIAKGPQADGKTVRGALVTNIKNAMKDTTKGFQNGCIKLTAQYDQQMRLFVVESVEGLVRQTIIAFATARASGGSTGEAEGTVKPD